MARGEPVEVERGVDLAVVVLEVRQRIDPEHLDHQLGDVLDVDVERDRGVGGEPARVVRAPRQLDPVAQRGGARRTEHPGRAIGVGLAGQQLGRRDLGVEPAAVEPGRVALGVGEPALHGVAHQLLVVARRRQPGDLAEVDAELGDLVAADPVEPPARQVARRARQREVGEQPLAIDRLPAPPRGVEHVPQHVGLERVGRRRQLADEPPQLVEVRRARVAIELEVDGGRRPQPGHDRGDPPGVAAQLGAQPGERDQLVARQLAVDRQRAEPARVALGELVGRQGHDLGLRRVAEPAEHHASPGRLQLPLDQLGDPLVGDLRQAGVDLRGLAQERDRIERAVGEPGRPRRIDVPGPTSASASCQWLTPSQSRTWSTAAGGDAVTR